MDGTDGPFTPLFWYLNGEVEATSSANEILREQNRTLVEQNLTTESNLSNCQTSNRNLAASITNAFHEMDEMEAYILWLEELAIKRGRARHPTNVTRRKRTWLRRQYYRIRTREQPNTIRMADQMLDNLAEEPLLDPLPHIIPDNE